jgi:amidophosphoribosyltransferase
VDGGDRVIQDKCGVVGVVTRGTEVSGLLYYAMMNLQHRGQESCGVVIAKPATEGGKVEFQVHKGMGLVEPVMTPDTLAKMKGTVGIAHTRYATTGASALENAQPFVVQGVQGPLALGHNGDIPNSDSLKDDLQRRGWAFVTGSDSEVALRLIASDLAETRNPVRAIRATMSKLQGSYCFTILIGDKLYAVRDPLGIKPLCYGELEDGYMVASESVALDTVHGRLVRDLEPGEILELGPDGVKSYPGPGQGEKAHCMFEWVYFARADSVIDQRPVYDVRLGLGRNLAKEAPVQADVVVAVPDSGRAHALGFALQSKVPFAEGLMKNRYVHRTFIMPGQQNRQSSVHLKLNAVPSVVKGKRVVLVDDSIVRGTTMRRIVRLLREAGATEVHVRIGSPPITAPCYLGIDFKDRKQLIAADKGVPDIQEYLGADSLAYLSHEGLVAALEKPKRDLCMGCLTGEYPVPIEGERQRFQKSIEAFTTPPAATPAAPATAPVHGRAPARAP